jgi:hypothetical protein
MNMNSAMTRALFWPLCAVLVATIACKEQAQTGRTATTFLQMKTVPDSNFLANLEVNGKQFQANFDVKDNFARCVASSDPRMKGLQGQFQLIGNGVFLISLGNDHHRASQFWVFGEGGSATIKEIPDRGERQKAAPVASDSL